MFKKSMGFVLFLMLLGYGCGYGSDDRTLIAALSEDDYAHAGENGIRWGVQAEGVGACGQVLEAANALHGSDYARMFEVMATVFAPLYVGCIHGIDQRGVQVSFEREGWRGDG